MVSSAQIRDMLSGGGIFGLRFTRAIEEKFTYNKSYITGERFVGGSSTR